MKTVEEIRTSIIENKSEAYINLINDFVKRASELAEEDSFLQKKIKEEIISYSEKAESADCEYALYTNANAAEIWFNKLEGFISGRLTTADLFNG